MCGIAAIFNYRTGQPIDRPALLRLRDAMTPRGPDGCGEWLAPSGRVGLGHRRLSIIDLSPTGAQPMSSPDRALAVSFNGELYNYKELRADLELKGCRFQSTSDTEVLLHLYATEGEAMVQRLRGMYAFALWDERRQGLFLARDPFGIKPLYLADDGLTLRAASQVKALLAGGHIDTAPEPAGHVGFFLWGHLPEPYTLYRGIRSLPAGTSLWLDQAGNRRENIYCHIPQLLGQAERGSLSSPGGEGRGEEASGPPSSTLHSRLASALRDTVQHHLLADVPVGVFLSAGLDSTTLTALAAAEGGALRTVTLGFEEFRGKPNDEVPLAEQVARELGAQHQTVWVTRADFQRERDNLFRAMDQPSIDGVNTYFVSLAARRAGLKVALSGVGGDEFFAGYPSFRQLPRSVCAFQRFSLSAFQPLGRTFRTISAPLVRRLTSPKYASLFEYGGSYPGAYLLRRGLFMPWELPELLDPDLVRQGWAELLPFARLEQTLDGLTQPRLKVSALESCWYMRNQLLRDTDWAGMAHSLEIRTPLVDVALWRTLSPLLSGDTAPTKRDLAQAAFSSLSSVLCPPTSALWTLLSRPKSGFSVPVREWLMKGAQDYRTTGPQDCQNTGRSERGLRGWARLVYAQFPGHCLRAGKRTEGRAQRAEGRKRSTENIGSSGSPFVPLSLCPSAPSSRCLVLLTDAFGGHGGIAKFNRDLLTALCSHPEIAEVVALPRIMNGEPGPLPAKLTWNTTGLGGKLRYLKAVLSLRASPSSTLNSPPSPPFNLVLCAHIHLLPLAFLARRLSRLRPAAPQSAIRNPQSAFAKSLSPLVPWSLSPLVLFVHGIEAWTPRRSRLVNRLARKVDAFVAVSQCTRQRFLAWTGLAPDRGHVLPNCVDLSQFGPGPKPKALLERYGLHNRKVIMTLARLSAAERYKGIDQVLELLPSLQAEVPNLTYLIAGDGDDRPRLVNKARSLGLSVADPSIRNPQSAIRNPLSASAPALRPPSSALCPPPSVVFTGPLPEAEKAAHYRLADAYVMPGWGEGFGIVYLEAMACGIPVVASTADASQEAVRHGELGILVDPKDPKDIRDGILAALRRPRGVVPPGLDYFSANRFTQRVHHLLAQLRHPAPAGEILPSPGARQPAPVAPLPAEVAN